MCIYDIHTTQSNSKNYVLLCYRDKKHAVNAVKSMVLASTYILLSEFARSYSCYIKQYLGGYHAGKNKGKA